MLKLTTLLSQEVIDQLQYFTPFLNKPLWNGVDKQGTPILNEEVILLTIDLFDLFENIENQSSPSDYKKHTLILTSQNEMAQYDFIAPYQDYILNLCQDDMILDDESLESSDCVKVSLELSAATQKQFIALINRLYGYKEAEVNLSLKKIPEIIPIERWRFYLRNWLIMTVVEVINIPYYLQAQRLDCFAIFFSNELSESEKNQLSEDLDQIEDITEIMEQLSRFTSFIERHGNEDVICEDIGDLILKQMHQRTAHICTPNSLTNTIH